MRRTARTTVPCTVDIEDISKTHLVFQKSPFATLCRKIVEHHITKKGLRFRAQSLLILQEAAESHLVTLLVKAGKILEHNDRKTVYARDLDFVSNMDLPASSEDFKKHKDIPRMATTRLLQLFKKAGIRAAADLQEATLKVLHAYLLAVLENVNTLVQSRRSHKDTSCPTVAESDVAFALNSVDSKLFGIASAARPRRVAAGSKGALAAVGNTNRDFAAMDYSSDNMYGGMDKMMF